jgi:hypothetical protein
MQYSAKAPADALTLVKKCALGSPLAYTPGKGKLGYIAAFHLGEEDLTGQARTSTIVCWRRSSGLHLGLSSKIGGTYKHAGQNKQACLMQKLS